MPQVKFSSEKFLPSLPEECQANPGAYGFELALWLSQQLVSTGIVTSYPLGEDWGWFIEYIDGEAEFMIGCGSQSVEGEGYRGQPITWHVFVKQSFSLKQRLKGHKAPATVTRLISAIEQTLKAEGIDVTVTESA